MRLFLLLFVSMKRSIFDILKLTYFCRITICIVLKQDKNIKVHTKSMCLSYFLLSFCNSWKKTFIIAINSHLKYLFKQIMLIGSIWILTLTEKKPKHDRLNTTQNYPKQWLPGNSKCAQLHHWIQFYLLSFLFTQFWLQMWRL